MGALDGEIAVVTGARHGIGRAIAQALADAGARVAVTHHDLTVAEAVAAEALEEADLQEEGSEAVAVESGEEVKLHALKGAASRYGTFLLYCAP